MADKAHKLTDEKLEQMERHLSAIYSRASKEIGKEWKRYLKEAGKEIKDLQEEYDLAKKSGDKDEIRKAGKALGQAKRERTIKNKRFKALSERTAIEISKVNETALAYINGELPEVYVLGYNALADVVDGVGGYAFNLLDANTVKNLALADESLLPYKKLDPAKDIPWNMKAINSEVLQGIVQGESIPDISKRVFGEIMKTSKTEGLTDKEMGALLKRNKDAAIRSARTIVTGAENKGRMDSYKRAEADGIILQKEWLSSDQPGRTRKWHMPEAFDSLIVDIDKPFHNAVGDIMFPGDPGAHPANVYNCRCSLGARVVGFKKI